MITSADLGNLHYLRRVIKETLRLHPPAAVIRRAARERCQVMGYNIPKDIPVMINLFAVGRDARHWGQDAAEFRPERFEDGTATYKGSRFEYLPFGSGRRNCPGDTFGLAVLELMVARLLYYFDWVLPDGACPYTLDMSEKFGITVSRRYDLQLIAIPST